MANSLFDLAQAYLNQGMPSISPIFQTSNVVTPNNSVVPVENILPINTNTGAQLYDGGGGEDSNPYIYNPNDPNIRTYVNPFPMQGPMNQREGILGLKDKAANYLNNNMIMRGIKTAESMLPVNPGAYLSNELAGKGFRITNSGQIVAGLGDINTAENIMSGYNVNKIDRDTFQKRRTMIEENLKAGKYRDPEKMQEKLDAINAAEELFFGAKATATDIANTKRLKKDQKKTGMDIVDIDTLFSETGAYDPAGTGSVDDLTIEEIMEINKRKRGNTLGAYPGMGITPFDPITSATYAASISPGKDNVFPGSMPPGDGTGSRGSYDEETFYSGGPQYTGLGSIGTGGALPPSQGLGQSKGPSSKGLGSIGSGGSTAANKSRTSSRVSGGRTRAYGL